MSEMVTMRTPLLWTCLTGRPRWIVGWQQTSAGTRKCFSRISRRIRQAPSTNSLMASHPLALTLH